MQIQNSFYLEPTKDFYLHLQIKWLSRKNSIRILKQVAGWPWRRLIATSLVSNVGKVIPSLISGVSLEEVPCLRLKISPNVVIPVDATKAERRRKRRRPATRRPPLHSLLRKFDVPTTVDKNEGREASLSVLLHDYKVIHLMTEMGYDPFKGEGLCRGRGEKKPFEHMLTL